VPVFALLPQVELGVSRASLPQLARQEQLGLSVNLDYPFLHAIKVLAFGNFLLSPEDEIQKSATCEAELS
jgi:hypothetical protein